MKGFLEGSEEYSRTYRDGIKSVVGHEEEVFGLVRGLLIKGTEREGVKGLYGLV